MPTTRSPRHGSLQYWPRKRAKREVPRIRKWAKVEKPGLIGFPGYKVGMLHLFLIDAGKNSLTKGQEIKVPATIVEVPPVKIYAVRFYKQNEYGKYVYKDLILSQDEVLKRVVKLPKKNIINSMVAKFNELEKELKSIADIKVLVFTQPYKTGIGKKKPEIVELALGGSVEEKYKFVKEHIGKEIPFSAFFKAGMFVDVHGVTKGYGLEGPVRRFGISLKPHKSEKGVRRPGSLGAWTPKKVDFHVAMAGQVGYHLRTEYNKEILLVSHDLNLVNTKGGINKYGNVKNEFVLIKGSIPGHKKRIVVLTMPIRNTPSVEAPKITQIIKENQ